MVVADAARPWLGGFGRAEEADGAAFHLIVWRGIPEFVISGKCHAALVHGERGEVIGDEFKCVIAAKKRDSCG